MGLPGQRSFSKVKTFLDCQTADYEEENQGALRGENTGSSQLRAAAREGFRRAGSFLEKQIELHEYELP